MQFGDNLRNLRKRKGLSQKQLADRLKIGQTTIANYESNRRFPKQKLLLDLATALEVTTDVLLGLPDNNSGEIESSVSPVLYPQFAELVLKNKADLAMTMALDLVRRGMETIDFYIQYILPLLYQTDELYQTGALNSCQQNIIHDLMIKIMHSLIPYNHSHYQSDKKVLLLAMDNANHLIGLEIANETFRYYGWECYFVGRTVPWPDVAKTINQQKIDYLALSINVELDLIYLNRLIDYIMDTTNATVVVGGTVFISENKIEKKINTPYIMHTNHELVAFIEAANKKIKSKNIKKNK